MKDPKEPKPPRCPHGCGPLRWVDDQWFCPKCKDEWADETVRPEAS